MSASTRTPSPTQVAETKQRERRDLAARRLGEVYSRAEAEGRQLTVVEQRSADELLDDVTRHETGRALLSEMREANRARASVRREPLTYERHGQWSWFADVAKQRVGVADAKVTERLARHAREMEHVDLRALQDKAREARQRDVPVEQRVNPNRVAGQGGNFAPPKWIVEDFATAPRVERVLSTLIGPVPIEARPGFATLNLPRVVTGNAVGTSSDLADVPNADMTDAQVTTPLVPIAGHADVAIQLMEQSPAGAAHLDEVILRELTSAYDQAVELQLINGQGGQSLTGVLPSVPTANQVTFTSGSPTAILAYPLLAQTGGVVANARKRPPTAYLMRFGRFAWLASSFDDQHRPFIPPSMDPPEFDDMAPPHAVASLFGVPVYLTEAIPSTLGAGGNQDAVLAVRPQGMRLWESDAILDVLTEPLSGSLGVRVRLRAYVGAMVARYPSGLGSLTGTGLVVQANL